VDATDIGLADPQVLGPVDRDDLRLRHHGEPFPGLLRAQVVVVLGDQRDQRLARIGPRGKVFGRADLSGGLSRTAPAMDGSLPYIRVRSVPKDHPTSHRLGSSGDSWYSASSIAAATSNRSPSALSKLPCEVPRGDETPRRLNRSTARSARAGSRKAAFLKT